MSGFSSTTGNDPQVVDVAGLTPTDNGVIIGNGTNFVVETGTTLFTSLGLASGTYTPTCTAITNVDTVAPSGVAQYMRVGSTVVVSGRVDVDPTSTGATAFRISLPIASNFGGAANCGGTFASQTTAGSVTGDGTNDEARFDFISPISTSLDYYYTYTYRII